MTETFGVHFTTDLNEINEREVNKYFSRYGRVVFVKQIQRRVYVNFQFKTDAEKCLQDTANEYGEISRGRFGPKETLSSRKETGFIGSEYDKFHERTENFEKKPRNSSGSAPMVRTSFHEKDSTFTNYLHKEDSETHNDRKKSPRCGNGTPGQKANNKVSLSPRENNRQIQDNCSSSWFDSDGPPPLLSAHEPQNTASKKMSLKSPRTQPPLLPTPSIPPLLPTPSVPPLLPTPSISPLLPTPSIPPLLLSPREARLVEVNPYQNDSDQPPPLLTAPRDMERFSTVPSWSEHDGSDVLPPLVTVPLQNNSKSLQDTSSEYSDEYYYRKYGNHILIANIPEDTTPDEIEKVLYPHVPIYISEPDITNIRMKVLFCHVTFNTGKEASKAADQMNGVELRRHRLCMIRLDELFVQ